MIYSIRSQVLALRFAGTAFISGLALFFATSSMHPAGADPADSAAAFAEYARNAAWTDVHTGQFFGVLVLMLGFAALYRRLTADGEVAAMLGWLGALATAATIAVIAALQAVDGPALKFVVDQLAAAASGETATAMRVAEAMRWLEVGMNSYFRILLGLVLALFGAAMAVSRLLPRWLGWFGLAAGLGSVGQGIYVGHYGFAIASPLVALPTYLFLLWFVVAGVALWRRSFRVDGARLLDGAQPAAA